MIEKAVTSWINIITGPAGPEAAERRAYAYNDLGSFLRDAGDDRCFECFICALRLTRSPGRKMRTLGRLGDAAVLLHRDYERARKFYRAAIIVGNRAGCNPLHVQQARSRLEEIDLDRLGRHEEFNARRKDAASHNRAILPLLRDLEVPPL